MALVEELSSETVLCFYHLGALRAREQRQELHDKVDHFLGHLESKKEDDVQSNAQILAEIIKNFSLTFSVSHQDIMKVINQERDGLNVESIRKKLLDVAQKSE